MTEEEFEAHSRLLEKRYLEMEAENERMKAEAKAKAERDAADARIQKPCKTCKYADGEYCTNALVKGFNKTMVNFDYWAWTGRESEKYCTPHKVLWEPIPVHEKLFISPWFWFVFLMFISVIFILFGIIFNTFSGFVIGALALVIAFGCILMRD